MADLFSTTILCEDCNRKTNKGELFRDGFKLRYWECDNCNKKWFHPLDQQDYETFQKLKQKKFQVKLRMVGNSYAISIPKERPCREIKSAPYAGRLYQRYRNRKIV